MGDAAGAEAPRYERGTLTNAQGLAIATHTWACAGEAKGEAQARAARARARGGRECTRARGRDGGRASEGIACTHAD